MANTKAHILESAKAVVRLQGYGDLSHALMAKRLGIGMTSVQLHFPREAELRAAVAASYRDAFRAQLENLPARCANSLAILERYVALFRRARIEDSRLSLCGLCGREPHSLPPEVRGEVALFIDLNVAWLTGVLRHGQQRGELRLEADATAEARLFLAVVEGAMVMARSSEAEDAFDESVATLLKRYRVSEI